MSHITIIGAGAAGATLSLLLRQEGHQVSLYDGRPDSRLVSGPAYRTIAVTLSERGFSALRRVGMEEAVLAKSMAVTGRVMHSRAGEVFTQQYGSAGQTLQCIARMDLDQLFLDEIARVGDIPMHFLHECVAIDPTQRRTTIKDKQTGRVFEVESDYVIGADGPGSQVRQCLETVGVMQAETISFSGGYKEFPIPAAQDGSWLFDPGYVHIWPRGDYVFIAFPALAGEFIAMLFMPGPAGDNLAPFTDPEDERDFIANEFADLIHVAPHVADRCTATALIPLRRLRCHPWTYAERFTLIGDAAHTILPFYGQGMNCTLEDSEVLADCLGRTQKTTAPLSHYQQLRKPNADAIDELALEHYHYLSAFAETAESIRTKELETALQQRYPADFAPVYTLIAFTSLPYATCQKIHHLQATLLMDLAALPNFSWDSAAVQGLVEKYRQTYRSLRTG